MSILKLTPSCKDYLWGGSRLRTDFGVQSDLNPLAEAWVLSCHPDGPSYLPDGTMLADYLAAHPEAAGTDCKKFEMFPVLTKFIDAKNNISIQVHPPTSMRWSTNTSTARPRCGMCWTVNRARSCITALTMKSVGKNWKSASGTIP